MKIAKFLSLGLAAVALASAVEAGPTIRICGSTAFRRAVYTAITNIYAPGYLENNGTATGGNSGANQITFSGTAAGFPGTTIVKVSYVGSVGGIDNLVNNKPSTFYANATAGNTTTESVTADITLADNYQASTLFNSTTLEDQLLGVITFAWVKNVGAPSTLVNLSSSGARTLLAGPTPLSIYTGVTSDSTTNVYAIGRDDDSGTRVIAFADSGYGIQSQPLQYQIAQGANASTAILTIAPGGGAQGYTSGGNLANALKVTGTATTSDPFNPGKGFYAIGYAGSSDAAGINGGLNNLTWNGVALSDNNVIEGTYSFWSYEHIMNRTSASADVKNFVTAIISRMQDGVINAANKAGLRLNQLNVGRNSDGGDIAHL